MKTIPILKNSIRKNPEAGSYKTLIPIRSMTELSFIALHKISFKKLKDIHITGVDGNVNKIYGLYGGNKNIEELRAYLVKKGADPKTIEISQSTQYQEIDCTFPEPDHLYSYDLNTTMQCSYCNATFKFLDLIEPFEGRYALSSDPPSNMCPKCRCSYCCAFEYEKLTDKNLEKYCILNEINNNIIEELKS